MHTINRLKTEIIEACLISIIHHNNTVLGDEAFLWCTLFVFVSENWQKFKFTESNGSERRGREKEKERERERDQEAKVRQKHCTHRNPKFALVSQELSLPFHQHLPC